MLLSQSPHAELKTESGWTGKQGVRSTFCGNKSVRTDNRLRSGTPAFGVKNPRERRNRRPWTAGSNLVSARTDSRLKSENSANSWRSHCRRWERRTSGA